MSRFFDGVDDVINCGSNLETTYGEFTCVAWIKPITSGETTGRIFDRLMTDSGSSNIFFVNDTQSVGASLTFNIGLNNAERRTSNNTITYGVWSYVALTWLGTNPAAGIHIYINGVEPTYKTSTNGSGAAGADTNTFNIGNRGDGARTFRGGIAYMQMFHRVLSMPEILMASFYPGSVTKDRFLFMPLWGGSPEYDYSGKGISGTVTGALAGYDNPPVNGIFLPNRFSRNSYVVPATPPAPAPRVEEGGRRIKRMLMGVGL